MDRPNQPAKSKEIPKAAMEDKIAAKKHVETAATEKSGKPKIIKSMKPVATNEGRSINQIKIKILIFLIVKQRWLNPIDIIYLDILSDPIFVKL